MAHNLNQLVKTSTQVIPAPKYDDPNSLPVPEPIFQEIVRKPERVLRRNEMTLASTLKYFQILTPTNSIRD